jgi:hypothetical protein
MVDTGYTTPTGKIVVRGDFPIKIEKNVGVAANMYPGRLVIKESTDYDVKVADGVSKPEGFIGYEDTAENYRPATKATIQVIEDKIAVLRGGGAAILGKLAAGFGAVSVGDKLFSWTDGRVAPGILVNGVPALKVDFVQKATVYDTGIDFPAGVIIKDVLVKVTTEVAASSIDVGFLAAGESGDEDGLLDGESCVTAGFVPHELVVLTENLITLGAYLRESTMKDSRITYFAMPKFPGYNTDGTIKSLVYTTSAHAVIGSFYVLVISPGVVEVGAAGESMASSASDQDIIIEAVI